MNHVEVSRWNDFRDQVLKMHVIESIKVVGADVRPISDEEDGDEYRVNFDGFDFDTETPEWYEVPFGNATQTIAVFSTHDAEYCDHVPVDLRYARQHNDEVAENFHMSTAPIHMNVKRPNGMEQRIVFETTEESEFREEGLIVLDFRRDTVPHNDWHDSDEVIRRALDHPKLTENVNEFLTGTALEGQQWATCALYCYVKFKNPLEVVMFELGQLLAREHMRPMLPPETIAQVTKYARNTLKF